MAQISSKPLKKEVEKEIETRFATILLDLERNKAGHRFLEDFFTETEQIMFAKRISALFLLAQDITPYRVARILGMTAMTTAKYAKELERGTYAYIHEIVRSEKKRADFHKNIEALLRCGLPPRGKGRWKQFYERYGDKKK